MNNANRESGGRWTGNFVARARRSRRWRGFSGIAEGCCDFGIRVFGVVRMDGGNGTDKAGE
jgi:hypothetical protein